jgi:hypothetical protein
MNEREIKSSLNQFLNGTFSHEVESTIFDELRVAGGGAIADMARVSDTLECFEIKSEFDSLKRLVQQGWYYGRVFDHIYLVCAPKHTGPATQLIPDWWGILEVTSPGEFKNIRHAKQNPDQDREALLELLSQQEAESLLSTIDALRGYKGKSLVSLRSRLNDLYPVEKLKETLYKTLIKRGQSQFLTQT